MQLIHIQENPFALLIAPEAVFAALEQSDCLHTLMSRVCKPLDEREAKGATPQVTTLNDIAFRCSS
jgi:hypothetical protein